MEKCRQQLLNSLHNLSISYDKLCAEYWVIRAEGGIEAAENLKIVTDAIAEKIKEINAELAVKEAFS